MGHYTYKKQVKTRSFKKRRRGMRNSLHKISNVIGKEHLVGGKGNRPRKKVSR